MPPWISAHATLRSDATDNRPMHGLHLIADLHDCRCDPALLCDAARLRRLCLAEVESAGLHAVGDLFHAFPPSHPEQPGGVTGVVLLAESHLALHTWPELGAVTLDVYVCNRSTDASDAARRLMEALRRHLQPGREQVQQVERNALPAPVSWHAEPLRYESRTLKHPDLPR